MSNAKQVTAAEFQREVHEAAVPVVVDFFTTWCGPCRTLAPVLDKLAADYAGRVKVLKVNAEEEPALAQAHRLQGVPTLIFFRDGAEADRVVGLYPAAELQRRFAALTAAPAAVRLGSGGCGGCCG